MKIPSTDALSLPVATDPLGPASCGLYVRAGEKPLFGDVLERVPVRRPQEPDRSDNAPPREEPYADQWNPQADRKVETPTSDQANQPAAETEPDDAPGEKSVNESSAGDRTPAEIASAVVAQPQAKPIENPLRPLAEGKGNEAGANAGPDAPVVCNLPQLAMEVPATAEEGAIAEQATIIDPQGARKFKGGDFESPAEPTTASAVLPSELQSTDVPSEVAASTESSGSKQKVTASLTDVPAMDLPSSLQAAASLQSDERTTTGGKRQLPDQREPPESTGVEALDAPRAPDLAATETISLVSDLRPDRIVTISDSKQPVQLFPVDVGARAPVEIIRWEDIQRMPTERPPQVDPQGLLQRVARAFSAAKERDGEVRIRLSPPELGALRLEVRIHEGAMTARLETETSAARAAIVENLPALRERLADQGLRIERFEVDLMQRHGGGTPDRPNDRQSDQPRPPVSPPDSQRPRPQAVEAAPRRTPIAELDPKRLNVMV